MRAASTLCVAVVVVSVAAAVRLACEPTLRAGAARTTTIPFDSSAVVDILYQIAPAACNGSAKLPLQLHVWELHHERPAAIVTDPGEPIWLRVADAGAFAFRLELRTAAAPQARLLSAVTAVVVAASAPPPAQLAARSREAFASGVGSWSPSRRGQSGLARRGPPSPTPSYWDALPAAVRGRLRPVRLALLGAVNTPFDGAQRFLTQYATLADGRLVHVARLDLVSPPHERSLATPAAREVIAAGTPLVLRQLTVGRDFESSSEAFTAAARRLPRYPTWCQIPARLRRAMRQHVDTLSDFDVVWRSNQEPDGDHMEHVLAAIDPRIARILDLVTRTDTSCRLRLAAGRARTRGWPHSSCTDAMPAVVAAWPADLVADLPVQYSVEQVWEEADVSLASGREARLAALGARTLAQERLASSRYTGLDEAAAWLPLAADAAVAPAHFVALHDATVALGLTTWVVRGLPSPAPEGNTTSQEGARVGEGCPRLRGDGAPLVIAFVGRIVREKGLTVFLEAAALLQQRWPREVGRGISLLVIGASADPAYEAAMREHARQVGVLAAVSFLGFVGPSLLRQWYAGGCIDVVVAPYLRHSSETFALVVAEAMQAGIAVVHSGVGGLTDYALHGVNSWVVPAGQPQALAEALHQLATNASQRASLARGAAEWAAHAFKAGPVAAVVARMVRAERAAAELWAQVLAPATVECQATFHDATSRVLGGSARAGPRNVTFAEVERACLSGPQQPPPPTCSLTALLATLRAASSTVAARAEAQAAAQAVAAPAAHGLRMLVDIAEGRAVNVRASWAAIATGGLDEASSLLPGLEDVLCAAEAAGAESACASAAVTRAMRRLLAEQLGRHGMLCQLPVDELWRAESLAAFVMQRCSPLANELSEEGEGSGGCTEHGGVRDCMVAAAAAVADASPTLLAVADRRPPHRIAALVVA